MPAPSAAHAHPAACTARTARGLSLVELLITTALGALLLAGLGQVARQALAAGPVLHDRSEAAYQARFALQRVVAAARNSAPHASLPAAANSSGDWFDPVRFCVNAAGALIETTSADTACAGNQVIAERVAAFSVAAAPAATALDAESAAVSLTLSGPAGGATLTLSERLRLGSGTK